MVGWISYETFFTLHYKTTLIGFDWLLVAQPKPQFVQISLYNVYLLAIPKNVITFRADSHLCIEAMHLLYV